MFFMYGSKRKRRLHSIAVLLGPVSFVLTIVLLEWFFGFKQAAGAGYCGLDGAVVDTAPGQYLGHGLCAYRGQRAV